MKRQDEITRKISRDLNIPGEMDRRDFMKRIGGGLVISFSLTGFSALACTEEQKKSEVNAYLHVAEDGSVKLYTGKIEMGQGPITSLPMMLADELDVSLEKVDIVMGDTDICPWDEGTYGSLSTRRFGQTMRGAAAKARFILVEMAAARLGSTAEYLQVTEGVVSLKSDPSQNVSYGELTRGEEIMETLTEPVPLKKASEFRIMGTSRHHVDGPDKVTGRAKYSGDIQLPGMMYARMVRPPSLGAKLLSIDTSAAEKIEGTEIVKDGDFVAVLNPSQDLVDVALAKVKAEYEEEELDVDDQSIYEFLVQNVSDTRELGSGGGTLENGEKEAVQVFESEYRDPYLAHAPMENHTATAYFEDDRLIIWASTQTPFPMQEDIADELGIPKSKVHVKQVFVGGGFGGKIYNPEALEAARLAKLSGKPVQLAYSRMEEFMYDRLRDAAVVRIRSGIDQGGRIIFWDYNLYFGGGRGARHFYDIPNHMTRQHSASRSNRALHHFYEGEWPHPFYTGAWRGPSNNTNTWARESQIELMASAAGKDALEFRLEHLKDPKMTAVLKMGAEKFGWTPAPGPSGRGYGIACAIDAGTWVAVFAEVKVDRETGKIQVVRTVISQDMGMVVNPQGAIIQAEGGLIMGLGYTLSEEIKFKGRKMLNRNFDSYTLPKISWTPEIEVVLADRQDEPPQGGGEPSIVVIGGAVANAFFDATGKRLYQLPLSPERVLSVLKG